VWRNLEEMLKGIRGGKHGKRCFIKMNGGIVSTMLPIQIKLSLGHEKIVFCLSWFELFINKSLSYFVTAVILQE
jgi:hypothetical protein